MSLAFIISYFGYRGHALMVLVFSLPFLTPIPMPGLSAMIGLLIFLSGIAIALNGPIYLPRSITEKSIHKGSLHKAFSVSARLMRKFENVFKPRLVYFMNHSSTRILIGLIIAISGFILALPLPPGTNFPPATVCVFMSISLIEKDGYAFILGLIFFILKITLMITAFQLIFEWIEPHIESLIYYLQS